MPTYEYTCPEGHLTEQVCSWSARPTSMTCECGKLATPLITGGQGSFVRHRPYEFRSDKTVVNFGKKYGRSLQQQEKLYQGYVQDMKNMVRSRGTSKKADIQWLGTMPGEMVDSIGLHEGDPEAVAKNPVDFLKRTELYQGD